MGIGYSLLVIRCWLLGRTDRPNNRQRRVLKPIENLNVRGEAPTLPALPHPMKRLVTLALLCLLAGSVLRAETASVEIAGVKYHLAWVDVSKDGAITNEYVPMGETIDAWTTLLGVRYWPNAKRVADAVNPWIKMIHPLLVRKAEIYGVTDSKNRDDIVIEAWLAAPDRSYIEINLHRFVIEPGADGVKAYQFAQKIVMTHGKGDPTSFMKNRGTLFGAVSKLQLPLHRKME